MSSKQKIEEKIVAKQNASLESTNNSLAMIYEAQNFGNKAIEELARQDEQLRGVESNLNHISADLKKNEKTLRSLDRFLPSWSINIFSKKKVIEDDDKIISENKCGRTDEMVIQKKVDYQQSSSSSASRSRMTQHQSRPGANDEIEEQIDENLDKLSGGLSILADLAKGLNTNLDNGVVLIDKINTLTEDNNVKIKEQEIKTAKLLRK